MDWNFFPYSLQYIIGGSLSIIISGYILYKNPKRLEVISFFVYGLFTSVWMFFIFLHRIAPTADVSRIFFRTAMFFPELVIAFLLVTILCFRKPKKIYLLCLVPAVTVGVIELMVPIRIYWGNWGWSYEFPPAFMSLYSISIIPYSIATCLVLLFLIIKHKISAVQKKYRIILWGFALYVVSMVISNYLISSNPSFPPIGGIVTSGFFLAVAYAISLRTEEIASPASMKKPSRELSNLYLQFLSAFQKAIPGKELGVSSLRFVEYIEAVGLEDVVMPESGKLVFDADNLSEEIMRQGPDNILRIMKEHSWARQVANDFTPVLVKTYDILQLRSKREANEWFDQMLQRHGGFLGRHGLLAAMPKEIKIPEILKELRRGRAYLFKEEKPVQAYKKLEEALNYGFAGLCISKLHPQKVRERYDVGKASIFWLSFKKAEGTINPKGFAKLNRTIAEFVKTPEGSIVLLDCLDQIKFANGLQKSLTMLKDLGNLCNENGSIILISINPEMFEKQQLIAIEKELEEVKAK